MPSAQSPSWTVLEFAAAFLEDRASGASASLASYLERFPGDPAGVSAEYARLSGQAAAPEAPLSRNAASSSGRRTFGRFELEGEVGRGGQATVHVAFDPERQTRVALKILRSLPPGEATSERRRFEREVSLVTRLSHPAICPILEVGEADGCAFVVMPLIEGETFAALLATEVIRRGEEHSADQLKGAADSTSAEINRRKSWVSRCVHVLDALEAAHAAEVIHRDLKPANLMLKPDGTPVILDFGLARDLHGPTSEITHSGDLFGTPSYMSPEQLAASRIPLDARTDVFSMGVTLYECLLGRRPFTGASRADLYQAILSKEPDPFPKGPLALGRDLESILLVALEKDRDRRYVSAAAFRDDLVRWLSDQPVLARRPGFWLRVRRLGARNPLATAVSTLLLLLVVVTITVVTILYREADRSARLAQARVRQLQEDAQALQSAASRATLLPALAGSLSEDVAAQALQRSRALVTSAPNDPALRRQVAEAELTLGQVLQEKRHPDVTAIVTHLTASMSNNLSLRELGGWTPADQRREAEALRGLAMIAMEQNRLSDAETHLKLLATLLPEAGADSAERSAWMRLRGRYEESLGALAQAQKRDEDALSHYERALQALTDEHAQDPTNAKILSDALSMHLRVGNLRTRLGKLSGLWREIGEPAEILGYRLINLAPKDGTSWNGLGNAQLLKMNLLLASNQTKDALHWNHRAIENLERATLLVSHDGFVRTRLRSAYQSQAAIFDALKEATSASQARQWADHAWAARREAPLEERAGVARRWLDSNHNRPDLAQWLLWKAKAEAPAADHDQQMLIDALLAEAILASGSRTSAGTLVQSVLDRVSAEQRTLAVPGGDVRLGEFLDRLQSRLAPPSR